MIGVWTTTERHPRALAPGNGRPGAATGCRCPGWATRWSTRSSCPAGLKDAFNSSAPDKDAGIPAVVKRVTDPELPKLIEAIYGVPAPATPRNDLVEIFLTGITTKAGGPIKADLNSQLNNADVERREVPAVGDAAAQPGVAGRRSRTGSACSPATCRASRTGGGWPTTSSTSRMQAVEGAAQTGKLVDALAAGDKVDANDNAFGAALPVRGPAQRGRGQQRRRQRRPAVRRRRRRPAPARRRRAGRRGRRRRRRMTPLSATRPPWAIARRRASLAGWSWWPSPRWRPLVAGAAGAATADRHAGRHRPRSVHCGAGARPVPRPPPTATIGRRHHATPTVGPSPPSPSPARWHCGRVVAVAARCCWPPRRPPRHAAARRTGRDRAAGARPARRQHRPGPGAAARRARRLTAPGPRSGSAYLEQARVTGDPAYYPKAEGALRRSLQAAAGRQRRRLVGLGALANARHDFAAARELRRAGDRGQPVTAPRRTRCCADAETQLGDTARPPPRRCSACSTCGPGCPALHPRLVRPGAARPGRRGPAG